MRSLLFVLLLGLLPAAAFADASPADVVEAHFKAIRAEDYAGAEQLMSAAFVSAFQPNTEALNEYYLSRHQQLAAGYRIVETKTLPDQGRETAVVVVEFGDPRRDSIIQISERMYYYLIREKQKGKTFGVAPDGMAWRIDIFDALRYDTLADARRRPYLYTKEAWPEDTGRELKSRQGLFRLQWALSAYFTDHGEYPAALAGGSVDNDDALLKADYMSDSYPPNGFTDKPMRNVDFAQASAGEFAYYALDADGDGHAEDYWLLLHGAEPGNLYFSGYDTVYLLRAGSSDQQALAAGFDAFWQGRGGKALEVTAAVQPRAVRSSVARRLADYEAQNRTAVMAETDVRPQSPEEFGNGMSGVITAMYRGQWAKERGAATSRWVWSGVLFFAPNAASPTKGGPTIPATYSSLRVYSYGF